jgi:acetyl-CoA C-acetyltransferase
MPEAVIVSTARSPIGRAMKGSLVSIRPDDLAAQMVRAALDKVPELNPHQIDDLILGCGLPGGEQGFNMARVVAVELGYDFLPGTTVNRYCSSSLQTIRMAFHAIKAGEGDAFISAGVETVSRFAKGNSDSWPDTKNPLFDAAAQRTATAAEGADDWHDPRKDDALPDIYIAMGQTAENVANLTTTGESAARIAPKTPSRAVSSNAKSSPSPCPTAPRSAPTTARDREQPTKRSASSSLSFGPTGP